VKRILPLVLLLISLQAFALKDKDSYRVSVKVTEEPPKIDGALSEAVWTSAYKIHNFTKNFPVDSGYAKARTEVMITYNADFIYIGVICHNPKDLDYNVRSLRRDFDFNQNDNFTVVFDPFGDLTNGFNFSVNPYGVQREALISNGNDWSKDWDTKWYSAAQRFDGYWTAEMAIPLKSIRFKDGAKEWNFNFARNDRNANERSSWFPVPIQFNINNLAFTGKIEWEQPLVKNGSNIVLIPYLSGGVAKDYKNNKPLQTVTGIGMDAKVALSSSLNLDLTLNPDFSQVEVDRQITNLDRFELFFPERRQFFLENNDLFGRFGFSRIRPFFSRRIGLNTSIISGARLSGKIGTDWRVGLLNIQTSENQRDNVPAENFTVAAFQRQVFTRSNIAGIVVNKQAVNFNPNDTTDLFLKGQYNRMVGLDYNLASRDNKWTGKIFYHKSITPDNPSDAFAHAAYLGYNTRNIFAMWNHEVVGANYNAEVGFVPRRGYYRFEPMVRYSFFPNSRNIVNHGPRFKYDLFTDKNFDVQDQFKTFSYDVNFLNTSSLSFAVSDTYVKLTRPFDPTNSGGERLESGQGFKWINYAAFYASDSRKLFSYNFGAEMGGYFNGQRLGAAANLDFRIQPFGSISIASNYNSISLPVPYTSTSFFLIGPRFDFTFTDKLFFTTLVQYNEQVDNLNVNARFQWRFKPVSDFFLVYTDNYSPENFFVKNKSLVFKISYWLNV
jgi:hypothetical protein